MGSQQQISRKTKFAHRGLQADKDNEQAALLHTLALSKKALSLFKKHCRCYWLMQFSNTTNMEAFCHWHKMQKETYFHDLDKSQKAGC